MTVPPSPRKAVSGYPALCGLLPGQIFEDYSLDKKFRGLQIFKWIYHGAKNFNDMTDLPSRERERLAGICSEVLETKIETIVADADKSTKIKLRLADGAAVESVLLVDGEDRLTACLSTQVGCAMGCKFCKTGTLGIQRNLLANEIVEQLLHLGENRPRISNIVFMGMGEPLLNLQEVRKAIAILTHTDGLGLSMRKITLSTCGIVPGIISLADEGPHVRLAVSLTVADDALRSALMPVNETWNLRALKEALVYYQEKTGDRITLEAAIMKNTNTSTEAAKAMAQWIQPLKVQVNVIPWNPVEGLPYAEPTRNEVRLFTDELERLGVNAILRTKKGTRVSAACGQLGERSDS